MAVSSRTWTSGRPPRPYSPSSKVIVPSRPLKVARHNRGPIINITIFLCALFLILYVNSPGKPSSKNFAWGKIRYESTYNTVPAARGICPGLSAEVTIPVLVVARTASEPRTWLDNLSSDYHVCTYTADAVRDHESVHLQTPTNRGHEAMAYLTFIIDNYQNLPNTGMVFVHGSRFAWHNDDPNYDNLSLLKQLNVSRALWGPPGPATGYWNLKCDWSHGMCNPSSGEAKPQGSMETRIRAMLEPQNRRTISDAALVDALKAIFGGDIDSGIADENGIKLPTSLGRSDAVRSQCCAQFVVARENIWKRSKEEYTALRQWLLDGTELVRRLNDIDVGRKGRTDGRVGTGRPRIFNLPAPADDYIAGRVLSYVWHILFLSHKSPSSPASEHLIDNAGVDLDHLNQLACPRADECYCRLYGRCDLQGCLTSGSCQGQYRPPPGLKLPANWEETHS